MGRVDVIAVDGSPQAHYAFNWYLDNLYREGDTVVIVHVAEYNIHIGLLLTDEYMHILRNKHIPAHLLVLQGDKPGEEIRKAAVKENASLIILGTRGLGKMKRTLIGSVSEYVLHHSTCPVTVVRHPE
ncbi:unnamed protein product [Candidula unifasciata]|uniref:UspA domain-containing protein n=1 Tax=Candidula unifasciata TaxID=100452 RepID=A0A8S4A0R3_9EUPU|nr:unnamed protein product [Candidula unifasciata]